MPKQAASALHSDSHSSKNSVVPSSFTYADGRLSLVTPAL
jgi:hypothetical protein